MARSKTIKIDTSAVVDVLNGIAETVESIPDIARKALNRTAEEVREDIVSEAEESVNFQPGYLNNPKRLWSSPARAEQLSASIVSPRNPMTIRSFATPSATSRPTAGGYSDPEVKILRANQPKTIKKAFMMKAKHGGLVPLIRANRLAPDHHKHGGKDKLVTLHTLEPAQILAHAGEKRQGEFAEKLAKNISQDIEKALKK